MSVSETDSSTSHRQQNENPDNSKAASQKDYQLFEDQDKMIQMAIEMICTRFNQLFDILKQHGIDLQPDFRKE